MSRQRITSLFADTPARVSRFAPVRKAPPPAVATDHEHGYRMRKSSIASLVNYDGGSNALSLGPHHNHLSRLQNVARRGGVEVGALEVFRRKVDMRIEILAAALYAEGYSVAHVAANSKQIFGVELSVDTIYKCVRRAFGVHVRKLSEKQRAAYLVKAYKTLST